MIDDAVKYIEKKLKITILNKSPINAGMNNQLFKLTDNTGKHYLLKCYNRDERQRLQREFRAFTLLNKLGFNNVPKAYLKNNKYYFGLYSFEEGVIKKAEELTKNDAKIIADFLVQLHSVTPSQVDIPMPPAVNPCFSLNGYVKNINFRLKKFVEFLNDDACPSILINLEKKTNVSTKVEQFLRLATKGMTEKKLKAKLPKKDRRLNPLDISTQNIIFRNDGSACFIDFEYFGFDDPMRQIADFVTHDQTLNISEGNKNLIVKEYMKGLNYTKNEEKRLKLVIDLTAIEWITIFLYSVTPDKLKSRKFADNNFDQQKYISTQVSKINNRLQSCQQLFIS